MIYTHIEPVFSLLWTAMQNGCLMTPCNGHSFCIQWPFILHTVAILSAYSCHSFCMLTMKPRCINVRTMWADIQKGWPNFPSPGGSVFPGCSIYKYLQCAIFDAVLWIWFKTAQLELWSDLAENRFSCGFAAPKSRQRSATVTLSSLVSGQTW